MTTTHSNNQDALYYHSEKLQTETSRSSQKNILRSVRCTLSPDVRHTEMTTLDYPTIECVTQTIRHQLQIPVTSVHLTRLPGDASNRAYYRVSLKSLSLHYPQSLVLMQVADPEGFKQSEEAISTNDLPITELPFINIHSHLRTSNLPVPHLHYYDRRRGLLYLEDLGDITLEYATHHASQDVVHTLYTQAIDILIAIHTHASCHNDTTRPCIAFGRLFDSALIMWEFDHFLEYGVVARNGRVMCANDFVPLKEAFETIAELIASQRRVFTHRDYHARNLMVHGNQISLLDFQDALMGPAAYDLVSLLRDAYIKLDETLVEELIARYLNGMPNELTGDVKDFRRIFDFTSIQRNLKAVGRFIYIDRVKGNSKFLADIPRTLEYVRRNLRKYPELRTLQTHLSPYVPELH